jgi:hypothetical protein
MLTAITLLSLVTAGSNCARALSFSRPLPKRAAAAACHKRYCQELGSTRLQKKKKEEFKKGREEEEQEAEKKLGAREGGRGELLNSFLPAFWESSWGITVFFSAHTKR